MELSSFSENIVSVPYERSGETVVLQVNIDAFTPEFFRQVGAAFSDRLKDWQQEDAQDPKPKRGKKNDPAKPLTFFESQARELEVEREIFSRLLSNGVLKGWDITENGLPVAPTFEVLNKMPPALVKGLWKSALKAAETVKKREDEETVETLAYTPNGSKAPSLETINAPIG